MLKNFTKEPTYYSVDEKTYNYISPDTFKIEKPNLSQELAQKFCEHFISYFELFYGDIDSYKTDEDKMKPEFAGIFEKYILAYKKFNSLNFPRVNMLKYYDSYLNYAPIDKKVFMAIHYLLDVIRNIDTSIKQ